MAWTDAARAASAAVRRAHAKGPSRRVGQRRFHRATYRDFVQYHGRVGSRPYSKVRVRDPYGKVHTAFRQVGNILHTSGGLLHISKAFYPGARRR